MKHCKILSLLLALLFVAMFATGCWDSKDINDKQIATAIAFDKKDGEVCYYMEYPTMDVNDTSEDASGSSGDAYSVVVGRGIDIPASRENLNEQLHKPPYFSGISALILTENFAKDYLVEYLYRFRAEEHYRKKVMVVMTREDPAALFKVMHENNDCLGLSIDELIQTLDDTGSSFSRTTSRLIENLSSKYTGILMPCIGIQDEGIALVGYSVVDGTTITGFIPVKGSKGLVFLKAKNAKKSYIVSYKDINFTFDVLLTKKKVTPYYENGKIRFDIQFEAKAELMYGDKKIPYDFEEKATADVSSMLADMLMKDISDAILQAQVEFKCDYLQFDDEFRIKYPVEFENMDWQNEFINAQMNLNVSINLSPVWMMDYGSYEPR
jgi:Ger(x)C family germination protein